MENVGVLQNSEIRRHSRVQLSGKWLIGVLIYLIYAIIIGAINFLPIPSYVTVIVGVIITGPFALGFVSCFIKLPRNEELKVEDLFDGFKSFVPAFLLHLLTTIFIILWSLLLIIPGIVASLSYSMAYFILYDNPNIGALEAIRISKKMMYGYKWKLFCLYLSFIGWFILSILSCGIGFLFLFPYTQTSLANFYDNLKNSQGLIFPID